MKKNLCIGAVVLLILLGGYVIFTLKSGAILDEASPLEQTKSAQPAPVVQDRLNTMSEREKRAFLKEVEAMKNAVMQKTEIMPARASLLARGDFMRRLHDVAGKALLIRDGGAQIVRFEDFETDNGPRLHIYLSANLSADDFIDLGPIKATKGNVNYALPEGTDTGKYRYVLVWCKPFGVLFSFAALVPA